MSIGPYDRLEVGTKVVLNNSGKRGHVVSHREATNGVIVHTVQLTEKPKRLLGNKWTMEPINELWSGSYRFIGN